MTDMGKLVSSGPGSAEAAGFLQGVVARGREDRESRSAREKNALAAFMTLTKEGWKPVDEKRGTPSGEVVHIEGFGSFTPPPVEGESNLDLAKAFKFQQEGAWYARRPGETAKNPIVKVSRNAQGKWTWHSLDVKTGQWTDTGREAPPPSSTTLEIRMTSPDGKMESYARSEEEAQKLEAMGYKRGWAATSVNERLKQNTLEAQAIEKEIGRYQRAILESNKFIDLVKKRLKPGEEQNDIVNFAQQRKNEYEEEIRELKKRFVELVGGKELKALPPPPGQGRVGTPEEWDEIAKQALKQMNINEDRELTQEELNEHSRLMAIIAEEKGFKF